MLANKNNLRSELTANVGVLDTSIQITSWEWILWENNTVACLEHYEDGVCTKREIVKITAKSTDTFTVTRWFAVCIMNDETKQQWQWSQAFSVGDFLSLYLSKEIWESITQNIWINETALQTMVWHINAPRTCINNNCLSWKWSIDSAYNSKYGGVAWFGDASDGDCVITEDTYLDASREYNFNNLTICANATVRFEWSGVPTINVRNNFKNFGCIELKAPFVSNNTMTDCRLEQWCQICNQKCDWWMCQGWTGWCDGKRSECYSSAWPWKTWCSWTASSGGAGGDWWWSSWSWWQPTGENGWNGWNGACAYGWWWGGGGWWWWWWRFWNGWNGWNWWYTDQQVSWSNGWNGWNSGMYWTGWKWWRGGSVYYSWWRWTAWNGWNWYIWWCGGDWNYEWNTWNGWCGVIVWWHGWNAWWNKWWNGWRGWNAITNVYWFHLNARNIWNNCVNARWWNGGEWWNGSWSNCDTWFAYWWQWWNGANGWQIIVSYDCMHEQWCFDVRGGEWWLGGWTYACKGSWIPRPSRESSGSAWTDWRVVFKMVSNPFITNFNLENDPDNEAILISWKDPTLKASSPNPRKKTIVRVSTVNFPTTITDWTLVVEETTRNQYESTPFSMSATEWTTYYFTAFAIAQDDTMIDVQTNSITADFGRKPDANTFVYYSFNDQWINWYITDNSWNWRNATWWTQPSYVLVSWSKYAWDFYNPSSWTVPSWDMNWLSTTKFTEVVRVKPLADWQQYISYIWWSYQQAIIYWYNSKQIEFYAYDWTNRRITIKSWVNLNQWYCIGFARNWTTIKVYCNGEYVWSLYVPTYTITHINVWWSWWSWRFHWLIWELIIENNIEWETNNFLDHFNKTKKIYWLS